jgi:hypothetical protein
MRLNPFYPSDDPMSSVFYCFGGGGDDGGGGGDSRSEADRSYEDDFGFSSDLADKYSGSAADVGGRDNNGGDDRPAPSPAPSAMDTAIANALANIDTASLADISTPMVGGAFVDPTTGFGIMQDIPGPAMQSAMDVAQAATPGLYGSQATTGDSFEDLFGLTDSLFGNYETTPVPGGPELNIFDTPQFQELQTTNISLMDQLEDLQQGINMRQSEFDALSARYDELAPLEDIVPGLNTQLNDLNSQLAGKQDEILGLQTRLDDTFKSYTDLQGQFGTQSDQLTALDEQFGLSQQQIQDQAARIAEQEEAARRNRILGIAGVAPVASSAMTQDDVYNLFGGPGPGPRLPHRGPRPTDSKARSSQDLGRLLIVPLAISWVRLTAALLSSCRMAQSVRSCLRIWVILSASRQTFCRGTARWRSSGCRKGTWLTMG